MPFLEVPINYDYNNIHGFGGHNLEAVPRAVKKQNLTQPLNDASELHHDVAVQVDYSVAQLDHVTAFEALSAKHTRS